MYSVSKCKLRMSLKIVFFSYRPTNILKLSHCGLNIFCLIGENASISWNSRVRYNRICVNSKIRMDDLQLYVFNNESVIMKGCVQWNAVNGCRFQHKSNPGRSLSRRLLTSCLSFRINVDLCICGWSRFR